MCLLKPQYSLIYLSKKNHMLVKETEINYGSARVASTPTRK